MADSKRRPAATGCRCRSQELLDQYTGKVLQVQNIREHEPGAAITSLLRSLHTGDVLGTPTKVLFSLTSVALAFEAVTGLLMWWKPRRADVGARVRKTLEPDV